MMNAAVELMAALIGSNECEYTAESALEAALLAEVDPMHWCAVTLKLAPAEVMRRGAAWAGLAFFDVVPRLAAAIDDAPRLSALSGVRMVRVALMDRELAVAAPQFLSLLRLARLVSLEPDLRSRLLLVPAPALQTALITLHQDQLIDDARQALARIWPYAVASLKLTQRVRLLFVGSVLLLVLGLTFLPWTGFYWALPVWMWLVILPSVIRLGAIWTPKTPSVYADPTIENDDLPVYSILVPLRDEAGMVDQLCTHLLRLDYPPDKLQIIFAVESRSPETIERIRRRLGDARFTLVVVPDAAPRTKPKALDFALPFCVGEFVVVYDAEDRPDPDQLRRIVTQFRQQQEVDCIQAQLVIGNGDRGWLAALYTGDYAGLFSVLLPAFANWGVVMPLGGTSNHFRLSVLRGIGGWDAFNVTEDADLGVRLARRGLVTATSTSRTIEDAPTSLRPWLGQRTRWLKGWMQTFVVHNRHPIMLLRDLGLMRMLVFEAVLLGMLVSPLLHLGFVVSAIVLLASNQLIVPATDGWLAACLAVMVIGQSVAIATNMIGLKRTRQSYVLLLQFTLPLYWLLIGWATILALFEFAHKPFYWFKTPHTVSRPWRKPA